MLYGKMWSESTKKLPALIVDNFGLLLKIKTSKKDKQMTSAHFCGAVRSKLALAID